MRREILFAAPLFLSRPAGHEATRASLRDLFLAEARATPGLRQSNVGGWHGPADLFERREAPVVALTGLLLEGFRELLRQATAARARALDPALRVTAAAWAMVMEPGDYSRPHHHGDAHWAAVYYVDAGDGDRDSPSGNLSFLDPRGAVRADPLDLFAMLQDVRPVDGLLVFFPAWLLHHVHPYRGTRPRVSVACNFVLNG